MGRQPQKERIEAIYRTIEEHPGVRPAEIAEKLQLNRSEITRYLPALEKENYYLTEDNRGRLWPFTRKNHNSSGSVAESGTCT